jgi:hypothetical protein
MKNITFYWILLCVIICLFTSCNDALEMPQLDKLNDVSLKHPQIVGETEDGLVIKRYKIINADSSSHYVYVIGTNNITTNRNVPSGKSSRLEVTFTFNGKPIDPNYVRQLLENGEK